VSSDVARSEASSPALGRTRPRHSQLGGALRNPLYHSGYALLLNTAATAAVGIVYWGVAAHLYSRQAVGRSSALVSALVLVSIFAQLNLANTLPRFLPRARRAAARLIASSYGASALAAVVGGLAFVLVVPHLSGQWRFLGDSAPLSVAFVIATVAWGVFALQDIALLSLRHPAIVPAENFVYGIAKLALLIAVATALRSTGIFFSWVIALAVTIPVVNWLIFRRYAPEYQADLSGGLPPESAGFRMTEIVRFTSVDYVGNVASQAYGNLLPLLVLSTLGAAANGSFYVAWTIAAGLGLVAANFGTSLLVEGAAAPDRLAELTRGVLARCMLVTTAGAAVLFVAARPVLTIYGTGYARHAAALLALLALGSIPGCLVVVVVSLDRIAGQVGRATATRLILAALVLGGSWVLVKRVGVDGVAYAFGAANLLVALARMPTIVATARRQGPPRPSGRHRALTPRPLSSIGDKHGVSR
jgi:O-antigen/teichoic acid export membrane protein